MWPSARSRPLSQFAAAQTLPPTSCGPAASDVAGPMPCFRAGHLSWRLFHPRPPVPPYSGGFKHEARRGEADRCVAEPAHSFQPVRPGRERNSTESHDDQKGQRQVNSRGSTDVTRVSFSLFRGCSFLVCCMARLQEQQDGCMWPRSVIVPGPALLGGRVCLAPRRHPREAPSGPGPWFRSCPGRGRQRAGGAALRPTPAPAAGGGVPST